MNRDETRAARTVLRRIESHLRQSHLEMGAEEEGISFVDVIHHPSSALPTLNYVTPRKKTAWVSGQHLQQGIDNLREKGRISEYVSQRDCIRLCLCVRYGSLI